MQPQAKKAQEVQPQVKKRQISLDNTNMFDSSAKKQKKTDFRIPKKNSRPQDVKKGDALEKVIKDLKKTPKAGESSQKATPSKNVDKPYKPPKSEKTPQKPLSKTPGKLDKLHKKKSSSSSGEKSSEAPKIKMNAYAQSEKKNKDKFKALLVEFIVWC